jgi:allophanate hydrolase subunit 2
VEILAPGALTLEVGARAWRRAHQGVPLGGPADERSFVLANRLVGNADHATGFEIALLGPKLRFLEACSFALAGAPFDARLDGEPVALWRSHRARAGQELAIRGTPHGLRCYLAIGDEGVEINGIERRFDEPVVVLRVTGGAIPGEYAVTPDLSRRGIRLSGPPLEGGEIITEGVGAGAIQVPPGGQPIIVFIDQTTTGGYHKVAHVIRADLDRVGQLRPGDRIRFETVSLEEAIAAWRNRSI